MTQVLTNTAKASLIDRVRAFFATAQDNLDLYKEYKRTYAELDSLSNRDLADIGVRRGDIADLARAHVYGS